MDANGEDNGLRLRSLLPGVPLIESPFFAEIATSSFDGEILRIAQDLHEKGIAVFRFPDDNLDERAERIKYRLAGKFDFATWRAQGCKWGMRIGDAWRFDKDVRAIASNNGILSLLSALYGRAAWPFQTLNFPVGTQQHYHSDSIHFSSIPERFMCGVWVGLEDISPDAGPLEYYPGSHTWPIVYNEMIGARVSGAKRSGQDTYEDVWRALVAKYGIKPHYFSPRKGEAVIWAANLLHGGSRQNSPDVTRWSQVTHYFFENCCYITPADSDVPIGKLALRGLTNIATGRHVPNIYVDTPLYKLGHKPTLLKGWLKNQLRPLVSKMRNR